MTLLEISLVKNNIFRAKSHGAERVLVKQKDFKADEEVVGELEEEEEREVEGEEEEDEIDSNGKRIYLNDINLDESDQEEEDES